MPQDIGRGEQDQEALVRSAGGFITKIQALVDGLGNPLRFNLTPGHRHEMTQAENLSQNITSTFVIADKAYDLDKFVQSLHDRGGTEVIPLKSNRKMSHSQDTHLYKKCHLIECFFGKIKHYSRIFSRFDKTAHSFMAFLHFARVLLWMK